MKLVPYILDTLLDSFTVWVELGESISLPMDGGVIYQFAKKSFGSLIGKPIVMLAANIRLR